jgi:uncharacterized protein YjbJ (UPF0337 family)
MRSQTTSPELRKPRADSFQGLVGNVTGSEAWKASGEQDTKAGVDAMKQASANRDPQASGFGKAEELAGKAVGCEGMEKEGAQSKAE